MSTRMCPNAVHFKEFYGGYHGTCGETALATALVCATPQVETHDEAVNIMLGLTKQMISLGWASSSGSATMAHLMDEATKRLFTYDKASYISFEQPLPSTNLHNLLLSTAGEKPIVIEVATAGKGLPGDEAGVAYHFICIVGITDAGYICNDGDNAAIESHLVTYSWDEIEKATPCAVMVIDLIEGAVSVGVPTGWKDDGKGTLTATNGVVVVQGFRDWVLAHPWDASNTPMAAERVVSSGSIEPGNASIGPGSRQDFRFSSLGWTSKTNVYVIATGQDLVALEEEIAKLLAAPPKTVTVQTPIPDSVKTAIAAANAFLNPQAALAAEVAQAVKDLGL